MNGLITFVAQYLVFLLPVLVIVIFLRLAKDQRLAFVVTLAAGGAISLLGIVIASHLFYDPRPFVSGNVMPLFSHAADNGFPSDHMTFGATLAFIGYVYSRKIGMLMIPVALAVGTARVFAHVHSWIDIVGGIGVALIATLLAIWISRFIVAKFPRTQIVKAK